MNAKPGHFPFRLIVTFIVLFNCLLIILKTITQLVPNPYIDEIFHIPQAQRYCHNDFTHWDSKITTLPGLYLISIIILKPLEFVLGLPLCSVYGLRFVNVIGTLINFILVYFIQRKLHAKQNKQSLQSVLSALNIVLFPPLFFFTFLYYTEVWSTLFVLLMFNLHLSKYHFGAAFAGICATVVRQTNIIWVGFFLLDCGWSNISKKEKRPMNNYPAVLRLLKKRLSWNALKSTLWATLPYLSACSFFMAFVIINSGIVVGDRKAHQVVLHPMQNFYFLDIALVFAAPFSIFEVKNFKIWRLYLPLLCTVWIFVALISEYNLLEHMYLLADNRHLSFYIWRRIFGHLALRRLLTPTYVIAGFILLRIVRKVNLVFLTCLTLCIIANLTPQHLFDVRYFIIPYILLRLHFPQRSSAIYLETVYFTAINVVVFYIFFTKEFSWPSEPGEIQRIIW